MTGVPLTVLDLVPISSGSTAAAALRNSIDLAQEARAGVSRKERKYRLAASSRSIRPRSRNCMIAIAVNVFEIEPTRKTVSSVMGMPRARSATPEPRKNFRPPGLTTAVARPPAGWVCRILPIAKVSRVSSADVATMGRVYWSGPIPPPAAPWRRAASLL